MKVYLRLKVIAAVAAGLCLAGGVAEGQNLKGKRIGVVALYDNPYWSDARKGIGEITKPLGVELTSMNSAGDAATQASNVTNLISAQVDGAIVGPVAPSGAVADLKRLKDAGITTVCLDSCAPDDQAPRLAIGWVTTSGAALGTGVGKAAVDYIKQKLGGKATIAMVVCDSLGPVCSLRHDAINVELKAVPDTKVVAMQDAFQTEKAVPKVVDMLTANPDVNVIIANNQGATEGAVAAVRQLGMTGKVVVFGIDMTNVTARDLLAQDSILLYTVAQNSYEIGKIAAQKLVDHWSNKPTGDFKVIVPVQEFPRADKSAIDQYIKDHQGQ